MGWKPILHQHFRDKLGRSVEDDNGDPASWRVGKGHIKQVVESFPGMVCNELIGLAEAEANRAAAWDLLVTRMQRPRTTIFSHTKGNKGHYCLIAGAVLLPPGADVADVADPGRKTRVVRVAKGKRAGFVWGKGGIVKSTMRGAVLDKAGKKAGCTWRFVLLFVCFRCLSAFGFGM